MAKAPNINMPLRWMTVLCNKSGVHKRRCEKDKKKPFQPFTSEQEISVSGIEGPSRGGMGEHCPATSCAVYNFLHLFFTICV